jgi:hypothetical protein
MFVLGGGGEGGVRRLKEEKISRRGYRAPPESFKPMTGAPTFIAISITLQIFCACVSLKEPPKTVKS